MKKILITLVVAMILLSSGIMAIDILGSEYYKIYDKKAEKINIKDGFGDIIELKLLDNTDQCLTNCEATIQMSVKKNFKINKWEKTISFTNGRGLKWNDKNDKKYLKNAGLKDYDIKVLETVQKSKDVPKYCKKEMISKNSTKYYEWYKCGTKKVYYTEIVENSFAGYSFQKDNSYTIKIRGTKLIDENVDWKLHIFGIELDEWKWWNSSYGKCRNITIDNSANSEALTNYQAFVNITYDSDMIANFSDIRFVNDSCSNDGTELSFCMGEDCLMDAKGETNRMSTKVDSSYAETWVRVDTIPASDNRTISMYYNASVASASDGNATMETWDDFEGYSEGYDLSLSSDWDQHSYGTPATCYANTVGGTKVADCNATATKSGLISSSNITSKNFVMSVITNSTGTDSVVYHLGSMYTDASNYYAFSHGWSNAAVKSYWEIGDASSSQDFGSWSATWNQNHHWWFVVNETTVHLFIDGGEVGGVTNANFYSDKGKTELEAEATQLTRFDNVSVRQYSYPEPIFEIGAEESNGGIWNYTISSISADADIYEFIKTAYNASIYYNASYIDNASSTFVWNNTVYTPEKEQVNSTWARFKYNKTINALFSDETDTVSSLFNISIGWVNGTISYHATNSASQNTLFSYNLTDITVSPTSLIKGESITITGTMSNLSTLATTSAIAYLNGTSYPLTQSGTTFTNTSMLITAGTYYNLSSNLTVSYGGSSRVHNLTTDTNVTVDNFNITKCTVSTSLPTLEFWGYEERDQTSENFTMGMSATVWSGPIIDIYNFTFDSLTENKTLCIYPNYTSFNINATIEYENADEYDTRRYYLTNLVISNTSQNVSLYLLNTTYDDWFDITIIDSFGNLVEGAIVKVQRWYDGVYKTVNMGETGPDGIVPLNLEKYDVTYRFLIELAGVTKKITSGSTISDDKVISYSDDIGGEWMQYRFDPNIQSSCSVNASDYIVCTINNVGGTSITGNLYVQDKEAVTWVELCDVSETGSSISLPCYVGNTTGKQIYYKLSLITDATRIPLIDGFVGSVTAVGYGSAGVITAVILLLVLFLLGITIRPEVGIFFVIVGLAVSHLIGLITMGTGTFIGITAVLMIVIIMRAIRK